MMKLQESILSVVSSSPLSAGVKSFLQDDQSDKTPMGGILSDARLGWLALGPKLCVLEVKTGQKIGAWTFGSSLSLATTITCVCELPTPLADNTRQLVVGLACEDAGSLICVFHCNGSQVLRCVQTEAVVTRLSLVESLPGGPLGCCDGLVVAGTEHGELLAFDLNRAGLVQALKNSARGYDHLIKNEQNMANLTYLSLRDIELAEEQREIALESDDHLAINLNDQCYLDNEYVFRNPDGTVRMKAKRGHVRVTTLLYVPQLASVVVGYNFGGFQIWNLMTTRLEYTSAVNVECLPVTHFGFQEPCDDPRAFCYLWVVYSVSERLEEEDFPLAVMYSLTFQTKSMISETQCLYQDFTGCTMRFQLELTCTEGSGASDLTGGRTVACHTYSIPSTTQSDGDESVLNICQLVWECWADSPNAPENYTMLLFDLDQWYKDQMPETWRLQNSAFMCVASCGAVCDGAACVPLDLRLAPASLAPYAHVHRLEEHFYPNSLQYGCICLTTEDTSSLWTAGVQRQLLSGMDEAGPSVLLHPTQLYRQCVTAGLTPLLADRYLVSPGTTEQRKFLLSVALDGRLTTFLKKCAVNWASGSHSGAGCTLQLLVEWCWERALVLKRNARDLMRAHDRKALRCLEHCVRQLTQLASLLDAVVTKCCNLVVPDALSDMEERCKAIGLVATYFQVVQWFLAAGLLAGSTVAQQLPYPRDELAAFYQKRRIKLRCLDGESSPEGAADASCPLLYIDQLIEHECGGELIHNLWRSEEGECGGLYPPPSLRALLRVYLLPDVPDEHKHSLVLYLLLDYSTTFIDERYEAVIRRLMQFPTMFGLSNTAIKATQAFWNLDHRNFDFALDQLQCLTGNTLSDWQHHVVLSALLAQKKTQAALQYLHVRKPPPVQAILNCDEAERGSRANDRDKLEDWRTCCELYLARELVFEAMDVVRPCVQSVGTVAERAEVLNFFFRGCKRTGQLSKILQITLLPFEEEMFIKYLQNSDDRQCSDILVMYFLQQARYLEAQRYNGELKRSARTCTAERGSLESLAEAGAGAERSATRDSLVELVCASLPRIVGDVARTRGGAVDGTPRVVVAKPLSVFVQAKSANNSFVYKSSFIQRTIESASETWVQRPQLKRGLKRALDIEDTPFICTPKLSRTARSTFDRSQDTSDMSIDGHSSTPSKRARLEARGTPRTPPASRLSTQLGRDVRTMLDMPQVERVPDWKVHSSDQLERSARETTPQSILKVRRVPGREEPSPVDSRYLADTDDELDTASRVSGHTHCSDATNKHLRFDIPSSSSSSTPSCEDPKATTIKVGEENLPSATVMSVRDQTDGYGGRQVDTAGATPVLEENVPGSPLKNEESTPLRKMYKDNVKGRRSFSISANSSLNDDPHASIESIADIPIMVINPRYSGEGSFSRRQETMEVEINKKSPHITIDDTMFSQNISDYEKDDSVMSLRTNFTSTPRTPRSRPSIKTGSARLDSPASAMRAMRSSSHTPERESIFESPCFIPSPRVQRSRSRSKTPELKGKSPKLESIPEVPKDQDLDKEISRSLRTPEKPEAESGKCPPLEVIVESPSEASGSPQSPGPSGSPLRRSQRSRSKTPEVELSSKASSPRSLRGRSKTPERDAKCASPKLQSIEKSAKSRKPLSRLVLEANTFTKITKPKILKVNEGEERANKSTVLESPNLANKSVLQDASDSVMESTPMKIQTGNSSMADYEFSPIADKSVLGGFPESLSVTSSETPEMSVTDLTTPKSITPFRDNLSLYDKSVLGGYRSSLTASGSESNSPTEMLLDKPLPNLLERNLSPLDPLELGNESILKDISTGMSGRTVNSSALTDDLDEPSTNEEKNETLDEKKSGISETETDKPSTKDIETEKQKIVEIEREITEIEDGMCDDNRSNQENSNSDDDTEDSDDEGVDSDNSEQSDSEDSQESEREDEDQNLDQSSNGAANKAVCVDDSEVISLADSSDEDKGTPPKQKRTSSSSESNESFALQIDVEIGDEIDNELDRNDEVPGTDRVELEPKNNLASELNESFSESMKDDSGMMDKEEDPFMNLDSETDKQSGTGVVQKSENSQQEESNVAMDVFNDGNYSLMTEDNSVLDTDRSDMDVTIGEPVQIQDQETTTDLTEIDNKSFSVAATENIKQSVERATPDNQVKGPPVTESQDINNEVEVASPVKVVVTGTDGTDNVEIESLDVVDNIIAQESIGNQKQVLSETKAIIETQTEVATKPLTRKRTRSKNSNTSKNSDNAEEKQTEAEVNPISETEKESDENPLSSSSKKLTAINKSDDFSSPKSVTRGRSKEKSVNLDDPLTATPLRRSTRQSSKLSEDDNVSVKSTSSVKSTQSKASKAGDNESVKSTGSLRKSRRSLLTSTKPDLSVIPEVEDSGISKLEDASQMIQEYSSTRRLTRNQRAMLEKSLEAPRNSRTPRRPRVGSSAVSLAGSEHSSELEDDSVKSEPFAVQPIDPISLLNKKDFDGPLDIEEELNFVAERSRASPDLLKQRISRLARAASETGSIKELKKTRRMSVDLEHAASPAPSLDGSLTGSPGRPRRTSFNKALEALSTPKRSRRLSTDVKEGDTDSITGSPQPGTSKDADVSVTPSRRTRRTSSVQSDAAATPRLAARRTRRNSSIKESEE